MENQKHTGTPGEYFIQIQASKNLTCKSKLTGEEIISTTCPECLKEHFMSFNDFLDIMRDGELFGAQVHCPECSSERAKL